MNEHKTPEQIADSVYNPERSAWAAGDPRRMRQLISEAIYADRAQYAERISSLENEIKRLESEIEYLISGEES